jgi:xanthosine utilization system XapX-like protein
MSEFMARRRGLPIVIGIVVAALGFVFLLLNHLSPSPALSILGIIGQNVGTIIALIGLLLSDALGK